jgi:hypothetical protein
MSQGINYQVARELPDGTLQPLSVEERIKLYRESIRAVEGEEFTRRKTPIRKTHRPKHNLTEQRFGRLVAKRPLPPLRTTKTSRGWRWLCECDCGSTVRVNAGDLRREHTVSCGCRQAETGPENAPPGLGVPKVIYSRWFQLKNGCTNPRYTAWPTYGARGITMHQPWMDSVVEFYKAIGDQPSPAHRIFRLDRNKGFVPGNVAWRLPKEHHVLTPLPQSRMITVGDQTLPMSEWARRSGIKLNTILTRIARGWSEERAATTPPTPTNAPRPDKRKKLIAA